MKTYICLNIKNIYLGEKGIFNHTINFLTALSEAKKKSIKKKIKISVLILKKSFF